MTDTEVKALELLVMKNRDMDALAMRIQAIEAWILLASEVTKISAFKFWPFDSAGQHMDWYRVISELEKTMNDRIKSGQNNDGP